ncbi:hypothetical protein CLIB1444_05S07756 [[Candida] jaroonii]|uniref:Uncharacterized protein n=1 Tax=[Candida] jaroonii TaxID=467808 RepID=A0ACA9Y962_9ASCO|nr:hypothetical protein CLIB1444_05S07756 [[Candida] jaroonii]
MDDFNLEPINKLPIKRLFDYKQGKVKETTKLPKEFDLQGNDILFKVKLIGINYLKDFELLKNYQRNIVPGNKFIGKIYAFNENCDNIKDYEALSFDSKYLVFPYTNCLQQNHQPICHNCNRFIFNGEKLPCILNFEYGVNLNGGFQDYVKMANFSQIAIKLPYNVSNHDALFLIDLMLPFYCCIKQHFHETFHQFNFNGKKLIILNDVTKELNDILIILKLLKLNEKNFSIIDAKFIEENPHDEWYGKFQEVFLFNFDQTSIQFAFKSLISTGLTSIKARFHIFLFNQYNPSSFDSVDSIYDFNINDKTVIQFKLNWFNKSDLIEILDFISSLNNSIPTTKSSNTSIMSNSTFQLPSPASDYKMSSKQPWLWYEKDYDLTSGLQKLSNQTDKFQSIKQINKLVQTNKFTRICYNNKPVKTKKLNAMVF